MAVTLVPSRCSEPNLSRCMPPEPTDCIGQVYDDRPLQPCGVTAEAGGAGVTRNRHAMGLDAGTVTINYNMFNVPDQLDVLLDGVLVATTGGPVSGTGTLTFPYSLEAAYCTVIVTGPAGTAWNYTISCPVP
jgi:hypothetical protein